MSKELDEVVKGKMQTIAKKVKEELPEGYGFVVLACQYGGEPNDGHQLMYVSNIDRDDVYKVMAEFILNTKDNWANDTGKY